MKIIKLVSAIKENPQKVRFEDLIKIVEYFGYVIINSGGSHYVCRKKESRTFTIAKPHGKENYVNVKAVKRVLSELGIT